jgi:predicted transcriptional regulator
MTVTSVRLPPDVEEKLAAVAERARRTKSWLINEAVKEYLVRLGEDEKRWGETLEALASVKAGRVVEGDEMLEWIGSWGAEGEEAAPMRLAFSHEARADLVRLRAFIAEHDLGAAERAARMLIRGIDV